jgi:hypothetical protein
MQNKRIIIITKSQHSNSKRNIHWTYIPTPKAHRHLTKPMHRFGLEKGLTDYSKDSGYIVTGFF